jgi:hypothetical protein
MDFQLPRPKARQDDDQKHQDHNGGNGNARTPRPCRRRADRNPQRLNQGGFTGAIEVKQADA